MRNIAAYTSTYANPGDQAAYLSINRTADRDVTVDVRDTKGRQLRVAIPRDAWEQMLRSALKEFMEDA